MAFSIWSTITSYARTGLGTGVKRSFSSLGMPHLPRRRWPILAALEPCAVTDGLLDYRSLGYQATGQTTGRRQGRYTSTVLGHPQGHPAVAPVHDAAVSGQLRRPRE